ncbi:hypothetical protein KACHI17_05040 [Sediminibacterium sp. KACHI17]|uniref:RiboL-PSP-HEPN domain-containing protein n=1 Tax=Sediminibacterium sp. KACHI17 TaxID=1751071 RepID=A0AAT9GGC2_9BACT
MKENFIPKELVAHFSASSARGQIINVFASLETHLDIFLGQHFCTHEDKKDQMLNLVLSRITFDNKRAIFKFLIDNYYTKWLAKYPDFNAAIKDISDERNIFAHYTMDTTLEGIDYMVNSRNVVFIKFKNQRERIEYSEQRINELIGKISKWAEAIAELIKFDDNSNAVTSTQ